MFFFLAATQKSKLCDHVITYHVRLPEPGNKHVLHSLDRIGGIRLKFVLEAVQKPLGAIM